MAKISDIAKRTGYSNATVSKALNGSPEIPESTVATVKKVARELGYVPSSFARTLKMRRSFNLGVLFVDQTNAGLRHEYFSSILEAAKVEAEKRGYDLTFMSHTNYGGLKMSYLQHAKSRGMDGILIVSANFLDPAVEELAQSGLPVVTIDYVYNGCTAIMSDNENGMNSLFEAAYALGHRKIAFIHGEETDVTKRRIAGFLQAAKAHGLSLPSTYLGEAYYHRPETVMAALEPILRLPDPPTCVFFPDDISAITFLARQTQEAERIHPLSFAGYDGIDLTKMIHPMLSTYVQNSEEIGTIAIDKLINRIEDPRLFVPEVVKVKGHLQSGDTIQKR